MGFAPRAHGFDDRRQRSSIRRQPVDHRRGHHTGRRAADDAIGLEFAQLFGEHLAGNRRDATLQSREMQFAMREPVQDRQLPFAADGREGRRQRAAFERIGPDMVTCRYLLVHRGLALASCPNHAGGGETMQNTARTWLRRAFLAMALAAMNATAQAAPADAPAAPGGGQEDFDWEIGTWRTELRRLAKPLSRSREWIEYTGTSIVRKVLDGRANLVELRVEGPAGKIEGASLRLFNPQSGQWSLHYASARNGSLTRPVHGGFRDGRGEFHGQEDLDGKIVLVRFVISDITADSVRFEQAYSEDGGRTWETNWIAVDTRICPDGIKGDGGN